MFLALGVFAALGMMYVYKTLTNTVNVEHVVSQSSRYEDPSLVNNANAVPNLGVQPTSVSYGAAIAKVYASVVNVYAQTKSGAGVVNSYGSGVVMTADGYVLTNNHVVGNAKDFAVTLVDGTVYRADLIGRDYLTDLAVLKLSTSGEYTKIRAIKSDNTARVRVGDVVIAIGNPLNLGQSATMGIISALGRATVDKAGYQQLIQTDVALNTGNSGGALINASGDLIGINTLIVNEAYGQQVSGLGFAIPTAEAVNIMQQIIKKGFAEHPYFGAQTSLMTDASNKNYLIISYIDPEGPAYKAGLRIGDRIISIDGLVVSQVNEFFNKIGSYDLGANINLQVERQGTLSNYKVILGSVSGGTTIK
ncbi:S1C family serine protease [Psittacicella hinzii]|uniref:S1C family serine protease n=1 Tax=Psittacicella hinzii TaxID=2028575 RepID=UPI001CA62B91|nr:trypsin-like peptidase domain-containing protein [Psittacicella hinzii]